MGKALFLRLCACVNAKSQKKFHLFFTFYWQFIPFRALLLSSHGTIDTINMTDNKPLVGMTYQYNGQTCIIVKVYPFGTMDIEAPNGNRFRVTGLSWI